MTEETTTQPGAAATVTLREITKETLRDFLSLKVSDTQQNFVANNAVSVAQAHFEPKAWFRGIYADETAVGFVMLFEDADKSEYYLWRFMIDQRYQGCGYGWQALQRLVEVVKTRPGAVELLVSYVPGDGSPGEFYHKFGFVDTGEEDDGELVSKLRLS